MKRIRSALFCSLIMAWTATASRAQTPLGPGFTFQGQLKQSGVPLNGTANLRFSLWDAAGTGSPPAGGNQIGGTQQFTNLPVSNGLFSVTLDGLSEFGSAAFNGQARWLQIEVCSDASCTDRTTLSPRQPLTGMPYGLAPWVPSPGAVTYMAGNVGIGTTTPISKLHISNPSDSNLDLVLNAGQTVPTFAAIDFFDRGVNKWGLGKDNANKLYVAETGVGTRMVVAPGGNVGIGTTTPSAGLHIKHEPTTASGTLALEGSTHAYMTFFPDGFPAGRKGFFGFPASNINDISLTNQIMNGNIGLAPGSGGAVNVAEELNINSTSGSRPNLQITGVSLDAIYFAISGHSHIGALQYLGFSDHFLITNNVGTGNWAELQDDGSWHSTSDRRLKTDIATAGGLLATALSLRPVEFYMKGQDRTHNPDKYLGLIAQEVQPILPSLVHAGKDDMLTLGYDRIGVIAIGAIQEQQAIINLQQERIRNLEDQEKAKDDRINGLIARIERLEALAAEREAHGAK